MWCVNIWFGRECFSGGTESDLVCQKNVQLDRDTTFTFKKRIYIWIVFQSWFLDVFRHGSGVTGTLWLLCFLLNSISFSHSGTRPEAEYKCHQDKLKSILRKRSISNVEINPRKFVENLFFIYIFCGYAPAIDLYSRCPGHVPCVLWTPGQPGCF